MRTPTFGPHTNPEDVARETTVNRLVDNAIDDFLRGAPDPEARAMLLLEALTEAP